MAESNDMGDLFKKGAIVLVVGGVAYMIYMASTGKDEKSDLSKQIKNAIDKVGKHVVADINDISSLNKNGLDKAKEAADAFDRHQYVEAAEAAGISYAKSTCTGNFLSLFDDDNSTSNKAVHLGIQAGCMFPPVAVASWFLPAPQVKFKTDLERYCRRKLDDRPTMDAFNKLAIDLKGDDSFRRAAMELAPCFANDKDFQMYNSWSIPTAADYQARGGRADDRNPTRVGLFYGWDRNKDAFNPQKIIDWNALSNKEGRTKIMNRFRGEQESMLSGDYWKETVLGL